MSILRNVVKKAGHIQVRLYAVGKIKDKNVLNYIAKTDKSDAVRIAAIKKIDNEDVLRRISEYNYNESDSKVSNAAKKRLSFIQSQKKRKPIDWENLKTTTSAPKKTIIVTNQTFIIDD